MITKHKFHRRISRKDFVANRDEYFISFCKGKSVLHLGASDWPYTQEKIDSGRLLYLKIDKVAKSQLGLDNSKEGIKKLERLNTKVSKIEFFDLDKPGKINYNPDVLIFGETLEHLVNPGVGLSNIKQLMDKNTKLLISVPNAMNLAQFIYALFGYESQHPDHKVAFTYKTITQLLHHTGFEIVEVKFTWLFSYWKDLNWKGKLIYTLPVILSRIFPLFAGNIIVVAKKKNV